MRSGRTAVLLALAMLLPVAGIAGCGDDGGGGNADAQALLKDTFGDGHPIDSGRLALSLRLSGSGAGLGDPIDLALTGPFVSSGKDSLPRFALQARLAGVDQVAAGIVSTGEKGFVTVGDQAFTLSDATYQDLQQRYTTTQQKDREQRKDAPGLSALGIRPAAWLTDASASTDADVGGTPTTRVSGALDVDALLGDVDRVLAQAGTVPGAATATKLPKTLTPAVKAALNRSITTAKVTVDAGKSDRTLRRITLRLIVDVAADDQKTLGGLKKLDLDLDIAISDLGKVQSIATPKNAKPISALTKALGSLLPQATATTPQATTTTPETGTKQTYTQCLEAAGEDVGAIQQCAGLLNP